MTPQSAKIGRWKGCYRQAKTPEEYLNQRFQIDLDTDCWNWTFGKDKNGYGQCQDARTAKDLGVTRAHQLAWVVHSGPIPVGMYVCHTCDNPSCINPAHLFLGTCNDNVQDMMKKGRYKHPTQCGYTGKLTKEDKIKIMEFKGNESCFVTAKRFSVSFSRICQLWRGEA